MTPDAKLFQLIVDIMEQMCGDPLDVPARDYFDEDQSGVQLTEEEFARLVAIKDNVHMERHDVATNVTVITIKDEEQDIIRWNDPCAVACGCRPR